MWVNRDNELPVFTTVPSIPPRELSTEVPLCKISSFTAAILAAVIGLCSSMNALEVVTGLRVPPNELFWVWPSLPRREAEASDALLTAAVVVRGEGDALFR